MSFYDNSSLAFLPSSGAGKDGKAYSIKPTDGTGDFTFSRGSNLAATRVGPTGLIEKGRENLFTYSNQFDTAWLTSNASVTSGQSGYDGSNDAWLLSNTAAGGYLRETYTFTGLVTTTSVYAKAVSYDFLFLFSGGNWAYFDLVNGVVGTTSGSQLISSSIESVGDGWYRCSITHNFSGVSQLRFYPVIADNDLTGTSGNILIQDAQFEIGLAATDYIESGASTGKAGLLEDEPRFDYSGGATCPSLLLEPSRTNLVGYSELGTDWTIQNGTITNNQTTSPENYTNAVKFLENTGTGNHGFYKQLTLSASTNYAVSVFVKKLGRRYVGLQSWYSSTQGAIAYFDLDDVQAEGTYAEGTGYSVSNAKIEDYGNDWYRISAVFQSGVTNQYYGVVAMDSLWTTGTSYDNTYTGDVTKGFYAYGLQLEAGSYPTSYIPNHSGGTITRGADAAYITGQSGVIGQTEGTMFIDFVYESNNLENRFSLSDNSAINWVFIATPESGTNNSSRFYVRVNNSVILDLGASSYFTYGQRYKLALAYKSGDWAVYGNGVQLYSGSDTIPAFTNPLDTINFNSYIGTGSVDERERVNQVLLFDTRLSNADLTTLTTL